MPEDEKNEFDNLSEETFTPEAANSEVPSGEGEMIAPGSAGTEYNIDNAPDTVKAPPRVAMDGMEVTIKDIKLIIPDATRPWVPSRSGTTKYKFCTFKLFYDNGQQEFYSGVRVFPRLVDGKELYSDPSITKDGINQASALMTLYAKYKEKDINEVSLKEFLSYLKSQPKVQIKGVEVKNPTTGEKITKNLVAKFI